MRGDQFLRDVTFLIKTFERRASFERLIKSLEKIHPKAKVLVVDDSRRPYAEQSLQGVNLNWRVLPCRFDIGLGEGRNMLLSNVATPYLVLLDDDYELEQPVFREALKEMKRTDCDMVAVTLWNTKKQKWDEICNDVRIEGKKMIQTKIPFDKVGKAPMVNNCFIAKTESMRKVWWDSLFKIAGEHSDFALRAKDQGIHARIIRIKGILHHPDRPDYYRRMRSRSHASLLLDKYGCSELHQADGKTLRIKEGANYHEALLLHQRDRV